MREFDEFKMKTNPTIQPDNFPSMTEKRTAAEPPSFYHKEIHHAPTWLKVSGIFFAGLCIPGIIGAIVYFATTSSPTPFNRGQLDGDSDICYTLFPEIVCIYIN